MELIDLMQNNKNNWKELIQQPPYCINIKEDEEYILLKYNYYATKTDWSNPIVRQCRGIIFRKQDLAPVCVPFYRFYHLGQPEADTIDFNNCKIQNKLDGSLIKIWVDNGEIKISTNGSIDAYATPISSLNGSKGQETFGEVVEHLLPNNYKELFKQYADSTHMFELITPFNKVVVDYGNISKLVYLGSRNNHTFKEYKVSDFNNIFEIPQEFELNNINDAHLRQLAETLDEGIVVVDNQYHRVKVKNPQYLLLSREITGVSDSTLFEIVAKRDENEFLSVVQDEYIKQRLLRLKEKLDAFAVKIENDRNNIINVTTDYNKKQRALYIIDNYESFERPFLFDMDMNVYTTATNKPKKMLSIIKTYF